MVRIRDYLGELLIRIEFRQLVELWSRDVAALRHLCLHAARWSVFSGEKGEEEYSSWQRMGWAGF